MAITRDDLFEADQLLYYQMNPIDFIEQEILIPQMKKRGEDLFLSEQQKQVIRRLPYDKRITVVSGRGIGKSALLALCGLWFCTVFPEAQVIITAPSSKTLKSGLFKEYRKWLVGSSFEKLFEITSEKIYLIEDASGNTFIEPRTAAKDNEEAMSGLHSDSLFVQVDEGSKVPDPIFRTLINTLTGPNNKVLVTSNGTRNSGAFYDSHMNDRRSLWTKFKFSSEDSPFTSEDAIREAEDSYGRDHSIFIVDVLGGFAKEDPDSFMSAEDVAAAFDRDVVPNGDIEIGLDVARFGDDKTVLIWRHGMKVYEPIFEGKTSIDQVVAMTLNLVKEIREKTNHDGVINVKVDDTGVGGGATDYLKLDRDHGIEVIPCNFGGVGNSMYANEASIMWGEVRDNIKKMSLPSGDECSNKQTERYLREELTARRVDYTTGKIKIEAKAKFKSEFGRSPDYADALVLCFAQKKNPRSVLKTFDSQDKTLVPDKKISYTHGMDRFVSVYYTADRYASVVWVYYGNGELIVSDELVTDDNITMIASQIKYNESMKPYRKILGNDNCFGNSPREDVRGQFKPLGVTLKQNRKYNEIGALELLNELVTQRKIKVSIKCHQAIEQLNEWRMDVPKYDLEHKFGLAYALLNVISELRDRIKPREAKSTPYKPYSREANNESARIVNRGLLK